MKFPRSHRSIGDSPGFTLIELLVAMAVLTILIGLLGQVVTLTGQASTRNTKELDAAGQARQAFDLLATDLGSRPNRTDLPIGFNKSEGNDSLQFYSQVAGYTGARHIATVTYQIPQTSLVAGGPVGLLERGATGASWTAAGGGVAINFLPQTTVSATANTDYDLIGTGIFRIEFCYLLTTGVMSNSPQPSATDYSGVQAIIVALGVQDNKAHQLMSTAQLKTLSEDLPDCPEGKDPLSTWSPLLSKPTFAPGIPAQAVQSIRIYQRTFSLQ